MYLSDVGQSGKFADNAEKLGADLAKVEALAISHHHYDHGGGLDRFFQDNGQARVFLRQAATEEYVVDSPPDPLRYIGLDKAVLQAQADRVEMVAENQEVAPGLHLLTTIPDQFPGPEGDLRLQVFSEDGLHPDGFAHEMATVVVGQVGLVVLTGCAHHGALNMLAAAKRVFPGRKIRAVVGGFHLHHESRKAVREIGEYLARGGHPHNCYRALHWQESHDAA